MLFRVSTPAFKRTRQSHCDPIYEGMIQRSWLCPSPLTREVQGLSLALAGLCNSSLCHVSSHVADTWMPLGWHMADMYEVAADMSVRGCRLQDGWPMRRRHVYAYHILKNDTIMVEFDGSTMIRKTFVKAEGFVRYPFELVDFYSIEATNNKTTHLKSGSRNLDFHLANHRLVIVYAVNPFILDSVLKSFNVFENKNQSIQVTLWGALGDLLIEKKTKHAGMCLVIVISTSAKFYNNKLYLSSSSSTMIFYDAEIPALKTLRLYENSGVAPQNASLAVNLLQPRNALSASVYLAFVTLPLQSHTYYEYGSFESFTCWKIDPIEGIEESIGSSTLDADDGIHTPELKRLSQHLSIPTPLKPLEEVNKIRVDIEDSNTKALGGVRGYLFSTSMRIVGIKSLLNVVSITAALIDVNAAQSKLVLLENFNENYSNVALHGWYYMVFATTVGEEYDKVFNHLDMLNAPFEGKVFTCAKQVKPYLKFNSIKDAKLLLKAVEKRFGGNAATKKTQRNLLKQQYENFTAPTSEMLDQTFDRLQKLVSQLEILDEKLSQEDVNQKLLRSLTPEWNTHAVVWRNKAELETMSMDDLYNNLKVYKPEVKEVSSSSSSTQNMAFVSSSNNNTCSPNETVNAAHGVTTASTQVNTAYSINIDNLSDAVICSFFASQPNSPQLAHEHLQQIHPDDIEEIDLRWQMAMLTMRARRFLKKIGRKLTFNGNETIGLISPKWSSTTATIGDILLGSAELQEIKTTRTRKAEEGVCLWKHLLLQLWCHVMVLVDMTRVIRQRKGLIMHSWLTHLQVLTQRKINGLKWDIQVREITIRELRKKLEKIQKEKDSIQFNVDKFENASKSLNKIIECEIIDNCKKGLGYENNNAVPPPYTGNFMPPTLDLSFIGLDEFVNKHVVENSKAMSSKEEPKQQEKTARKTVKQVEKHRQNTHSPRGNQRNWNNMMSQKLGSNFEMFNKACYVCGSFDHLQVDCKLSSKTVSKQRMVKPVWNNAQKVNHQNFAKKTHPYAKKNMVPRAVLMKSGLVSINTARQVNAAHSKTTANAARPMSCLSKIAHSTIKRPIHKNTTFKNSNINQRVNTGNPQMDLQDQGVIDSGCSWHMTGTMSYLTNYEEIDGEYVAFGGNPKGGKITGKGKEKKSIEVNAGDSKLMLLGITYYWFKVNAARHNLLLLVLNFLNEQPIRYALTVNPTIYTSCIEQFWSTVKAKTINEEVQLHALVDGKKIIVTESTVRRDLQLEDAEGSKTTAWNEFSSTMASAIICLATNKKFNFSKYIFESMVKNLDNVSGKFLMYLRFVQVFVNQQLDGLPSHKRIDDAPSHTKKIFRNIKMVGKAMPTYAYHTPTIIESLSQPQKSQKPRKPKRKDTQVPQSSGPTDIVADEVVHKELGDSLAIPNEVGSQGTTSGGGPRCQETMRDTIAQTRRVESSGDEDSLGEDASKQERRIDAIDSNEDITLVNVQDDAEMFDVNTLTGDEVFAEQEVVAKDVNLTDKGKGIMVEEPVKTMKKKDQIMLDEEIALKLQAEIDEEERIARVEEEKIDESNIAWDDIQAKVNADYQLAERLQAEEQE
ncbi:hypothetical protein Tco_0018153 [Tanacetum coccineum]